MVTGGPDVAKAVGERVLVSLAVPVATGRRPGHRHGSVGVATSDDTGDRTADALLRNADLAMYLAKAQGKNRMVAYADGMAEAARRAPNWRRTCAGPPPPGSSRSTTSPPCS